MGPQTTCLTDMTLPELTRYLTEMGQPAFRGKQIFKWIHQKLITDLGAMTDQPKALLQTLQASASLAVPKIRRK